MTNRGLQIDIQFIGNEVLLLDLNHPLVVLSSGLSSVILRCVEGKNPHSPLAMCMTRLGENIYARALHANAIAAVVNWPIKTYQPILSVFLL